MAKDSTYVAAPKVRIAPITFVIEVTAEKVSQKGTFSGLKVLSVKTDNSELKGHVTVAAPVQSGGAMFLQTDSLKGVKVNGEATATTAKPERKLW